MKKNIIILFMSFVAFSATAQIPSYNSMESYESLVKALEPKKIIKSEKPYYLAAWSKDSVISTKDEISLAKSGLLWSRDSMLIRENNALLYNTLTSFGNYNIPVEAKYGNKSPEKIREYYEGKRLSLFTLSFDSAGIENNIPKMESVLDLMVYYYRNQELLSESSRKDHKKIFIVMRERYSDVVSEYYRKTKKKSKRDISKLFGYYTNLYIDLDQASQILDYIYIQERQYIIQSMNKNAEFENVADYYLALLYMYNIEGDKDITERNRLILLGYQRLFLLQTIPPSYRDVYIASLKAYLQGKCNIFPQ